MQVIFVTSLNGLKNLHQSKCVISVMSQSMWVKVCNLYLLPAVKAQLPLCSLTVFVRQMPVLLDWKKPSSPLRRAGNTSILQLSYQVDAVDGVNAGECDKVNPRIWMLAAGTADAQSYILWCSCACRPSAIMQESDVFPGVLQTHSLNLHSVSTTFQYFLTTVLLSSPERCEHLFNIKGTPNNCLNWIHMVSFLKLWTNLYETSPLWQKNNC